MTILDRLEASLADYRPRTPRDFVALQLSRRFDDVAHLARYLLAAQRHSKGALLAAANDARLRHQLNRAPMPQLFFEILSEREQRKEAA